LLDASPSLRQRWYQTGFRRTLSYLAERGKAVQWQGCGVFATAWNAREEKRHQQLVQAGIWDPRSVQVTSASDAKPWSDLPMTRGGLFFPEAGWVNPGSLCKSLLARATGSITIRCRAPVGSLMWDGALWQVADQDGRILDSTPVVVLCAGAQVATFAQTSWLPLTQVRGQLTTVTAAAASSRVRSVVTGAGYLLPAVAGCHQIGATYDVDDPERAIRVGDHQQNLSTLSTFFPAFTEQARTPVIGGRVGFRSVTNDFLPVVGPVPDVEAWQRVYGDLHLGRRVTSYPPPIYHRGLYVAAGLGSRGLTSALLAADLVVSIIEGEPAPIEANVEAAVHPGRFLIRRFRRSSARL
jgi:tRNA 5-methylaminomethyl-2-thiouridine biosynthesis bifunctional protein